MDYTKLTKQELLEEVIKQQTLADAIEIKDKEIRKLQEKIQDLSSRPTQNEVEDLRNKVKSFEGSVKKEDLETYTKKLEEATKKAQDIANQYIRAHRDLMRIFKANLDLAISHEELLSEKLK